MLTLIADSNIAHLTDYFNEQSLGQPVQLIAMAGRDITADILREHQPDALLIRSVTSVNEALLADNKSVKFVGSATIGTDHVDQSYLTHRQIAFANASGCSKHSVAQYVMTAILNLRPHYWQGGSATKPVALGIIGLGNIGTTLARYASDLGWQVQGYDPLLPASNLNNASFEQVLTQCDVISLHVPLTHSAPDNATYSPYPTFHLIDEQALAQMPASTMLINSARGPVISEKALLADLAKRQREVVLDVFEHEPNVASKLISRLAFATPHIAGYTLEGKLRGTQMIFDQFVNAFNLQATQHDCPLMQDLLPANPYHWSKLKAHPDRLEAYYPIKADDQLLRQAIDPVTAQVLGTSFDKLRKEYPLRREWLFDH